MAHLHWPRSSAGKLLLALALILALATVYLWGHVNEPVAAAGVFQPTESVHAAAFSNVSSCTWSPLDQQSCRNMIIQRLCRISSHCANYSALGRRFLVFGDSTMGPKTLFNHLYNFTHPDASSFPVHYHCEHRRGKNCRNNVIMELGPSPPNRAWVAPNISLGEGPTHNGLQNHFCSDCATCNPTFMACKIIRGNSSSSDMEERQTQSRFQSSRNSYPLVYGGYLRGEFARDVGIQTPWYQTTQENTALSMERIYNAPELLLDWNGRPICLISAGQHDAGIPNITLEIYLTNVEWYIQVMRPQCELIIWLGPTMPAGRYDYPLTPALTTAWNKAVRTMIDAAPPELHTVFVDVLKASEYEGFLRDNIHMEDSWYETLAAFFRDMISTSC